MLDVPVRAPKEQFVKLDAFDKAIESTIDFRNLFKWFRNQEDIENQIKVRNDSDYEDKSLAAVKKAMLAMLDGFEDIRIERRPLAMKVNKNGKSLKIDQLSDGEKCTIALFGDLARRMALANPGKDVNPLEGSGVVLIDELDLLFQHEYSAIFLFTLWKRVRKYGAYCTGITQNVDDLLQSHTARTMLANSEFIIMLNQASTDRLELAKLLNISDLQMSYITNVGAGQGLLKVGSSLVPFVNKFPRNTELYKLMTTKFGEV